MKNPFTQRLAKGTGVELRLEMDMPKFKKSEPEFVAALANALEIDPEEIRKINVLRGCIRYIIDIPKEAASKFKRALETQTLTKAMEELFFSFDIDPRKIRFNVKTEAPAVRKVNEISKELEKDGRILTWLHLSDVHFVDRPGASKWNQDIIKDNLIKSLPDLLASWNLEPNLLFFTGDIAFSAQQQEYRIATDFFNQLRKVLGAGVRIYMVPGNHDISWAAIDKLDAELRKKLSDRNAVSDYLLSPSYKEERKRDFAKFSNYVAFATGQLNGTVNMDEDIYFYTDQFPHDDIKIGVAALNSAWRSTKKSKKTTHDVDMDNLLLGGPQIEKASSTLESSHVRFALLHHPPASNWFRSFDRKIHNAFFPNFDFVLRGHEHETIAVATTDLGSNSDYVHIASGALYDASEYQGKTGYPISFNAVRLNLDSGKGIIFFWRYFTDMYKWKRDVIADDGLKIFNIPAKLLERMKRLPPNDPHTRAAGAGRTR